MCAIMAQAISPVACLKLCTILLFLLLCQSSIRQTLPPELRTFSHHSSLACRSSSISEMARWYPAQQKQASVAYEYTSTTCLLPTSAEGHFKRSPSLRKPVESRISSQKVFCMFELLNSCCCCKSCRGSIRVRRIWFSLNRVELGCPGGATWI